jgi:hypothetical protein
MASTTKTSPFQTPLFIPRTNQDKRIATAYNLFNAYKEGKYLVHKTTRAGCTTALVAESLNRGEQFLVAVPTNKIADKTVIEDSIKYSDRDTCNVIHVPSNHECIKNKELCELYPDLAKLPILPLADRCQDCENNYTCPVTRILHEHDECDGIAITYQKLVALMMASSTRPNTTAEQVLDNIAHIHNAVFDEIHEIQYGKSTGITIYNDSRKDAKWINLDTYLPLLEDFEHIRNIVASFGMLKDESCVSDAVIQTYNNAADESYYRHKLSITIDNNYCDFGDDNTKAIMATYDEIIKLTTKRKEYGISMPEILDLYKILNIVMSEKVRIHGIRDRGSIKIKMVAIDQMFTSMLRSYIMGIQNKAKRMLLTSATICSHDYGQYFMRNCQPENITFGMGGDPMSTNSNMLILADSKRYHATGARSRYNKKHEILERITSILDLYGDEDCIIIALSIKEAIDLQKELETFGHPHEVTYYKAPEMMGVSATARVMIAVGVADKPSNSYDAICETKEESLVLREEAVHCDTWQAWSRVKDPNGKVPSLVFALGCSVEQCESIVTWGFNRRVDIFPGGNGQKREVTVNVDRQVITAPEITKCADFEEMLQKANAYKTFQNSLNDIKKVGTICTKPLIYNIISAFSTKVTHIYNVTKSDFLFKHLINRYDTFAEQNHNGTQYFRISGVVTDTLIQNHVAGKITIGSYSTSKNGTCKWICFDVDAHAKPDDSIEDVIAKEQKAEDDLKNITTFLDSVDLKYLVESSGSPHSYHVWLFIEEVAVEKAYYFANAIAKEAGFDGEVNPKQRTWNRNNQYGNLVKLPFALHKKHNTFSHIHGWEGETMDISVYDISEIEIPKTQRKKKSMSKPIEVKLKGIRPCIQAALQKDLSGEQGNKMRVAIVREFWNFGEHDKDKLAELFNQQSDYEFDKSRYYVEKITEQDFKVWPQQTLLEKCPKFLNCEQCDRFDCRGAQ